MALGLRGLQDSEFLHRARARTWEGRSLPELVLQPCPSWGAKWPLQEAGQKQWDWTCWALAPGSAWEEAAAGLALVGRRENPAAPRPAAPGLLLYEPCQTRKPGLRFPVEKVCRQD